MATKKSINKYNAAVTQQGGRVGNVRYVQKGGETYVRSAYNSRVTNPRTMKQMLQRLKFRSLINLNQALDIFNCFKKGPNQSDYNMFIKANQGKGVFLNKDEAEKGFQIAFPVVITKGSGKMAPFAQSLNDGRIVTDIALGAAFNFTENTTVGELARAIVANNEDWKFEDKLGFVALIQKTVNGYLRVAENHYSVTLKKSSEALVADYMTDKALGVVNGHLATADISSETP